MDLSFTIHLDHVIELAMAFGLGAVIGVERDLHGRAAGLRTHMLVCAGAALYTISSTYLEGGDPGRIAAQIVSGIGFLGAGTILKAGLNVRGLTTAACMWLVAAVGMACGLGEFFLAILGTFGTLLVLLVAKRIENLLHRLYSLQIQVVTSNPNFSDDVLKKLAKECGEFSINSMNIKFDIPTGMYHFQFDVDTHTGRDEATVASFILNQIRERDPKATEVNVVCLT